MSEHSESDLARMVIRAPVTRLFDWEFPPKGPIFPATIGLLPSRHYIAPQAHSSPPPSLPPKAARMKDLNFAADKGEAAFSSRRFLPGLWLIDVCEISSPFLLGFCRASEGLSDQLRRHPWRAQVPRHSRKRFWTRKLIAFFRSVRFVVAFILVWLNDCSKMSPIGRWDPYKSILMTSSMWAAF